MDQTLGRSDSRLSKWILRAVVYGVLVAAIYHYGRPLWYPRYIAIAGGRTVSEVVSDYGPASIDRLKPHFDRTQVPYPPQRITLIALKSEKVLELWAWRDTWIHIRSYPVLAASGQAGPKLREGDRQVPEGLYAIEGLNPNSSYHLSIKLNYPNAFDIAAAKDDGRTNLGGDIFIHGKAASIGCIAIGDEAIEEVFTLVATVDRSNIQVIIAPHDFRIRPPSVGAEAPQWLPVLYENIRSRLVDFHTTRGATS